MFTADQYSHTNNNNNIIIIFMYKKKGKKRLTINTGGISTVCATIGNRCGVASGGHSTRRLPSSIHWLLPSSHTPIMRRWAAIGSSIWIISHTMLSKTPTLPVERKCPPKVSLDHFHQFRFDSIRFDSTRDIVSNDREIVIKSHTKKGKIKRASTYSFLFVSLTRSLTWKAAYWTHSPGPYYSAALA